MITARQCIGSRDLPALDFAIMKLMEESFLKPNGFKIVFSISFVVITIIALFLYNRFSGLIDISVFNFVVDFLYFPVAAFTFCYARLFPSSPGDLELSLMSIIFLIYAYLLACIFSVRGKSFLFIITVLVMAGALVTIGIQHYGLFPTSPCVPITACEQPLTSLLQ